MPPAAFRVAILAIAAAYLPRAIGAETPRSLPSRPGASAAAAGAPSSPPPAAKPSATATLPRASLHVGKVDYVSATDIAIALGCTGRWTEPLKKLTLTSKTNAANRLELEVDKRTVAVDGLRIDLGHPAVLRRGRLYVSETDIAHCLAPLLRPSALPTLPPQPTVIALDAGHGGSDNGMENPRLGLKEKVLALDVVLRLKQQLEAAGFKVVLTRTGDGTFSADKKKDLAMRTEVANRASADLMVSVHFNSLYPDTKTGGTEVYVYTPPHQRSSQSWSTGDDDALPAQPVNRFDPWSSLLAHQIHRHILRELKTSDRGQKTKHLFLFQDLNCPAALIESVFLSNDAEARRAATPEYRQQIAAALAAAIRDYAATIGSLRPKSNASATSKRRHASRSS